MKVKISKDAPGITFAEGLTFAGIHTIADSEVNIATVEYYKKYCKILSDTKDSKQTGTSETEAETVETVQCKGTKKDGDRCETKIPKDGVGYCRHHKDQAGG